MPEYRSRKDQWLRDELLLALDLYIREGSNAPKASLEELSRLLRVLPIEPELAVADPTFRSPSAVSLKLHNFSSLDPTHAGVGMPRVGRRDVEVWDEFAADPNRVRLAASAIRTQAAHLVPPEAEAIEVDIADAPEGRLLTRAHRARERNRRIVEQKKARALKRGELRCEACGFDFEAVYGERGRGFIECHHTTPVSSLQEGARTRAEDLALVCANCHRIIHRSAPWLSVDDVSRSIAARRR